MYWQISFIFVVNTTNKTLFVSYQILTSLDIDEENMNRQTNKQTKISLIYIVLIYLL